MIHNSATKSYNFIDLFAGAGGLALGIEKAGFDTIGLIEIDKDASDTLKCNRPEWRVINEDIANISSLDLKTICNSSAMLNSVCTYHKC